MSKQEQYHRSPYITPSLGSDIPTLRAPRSGGVRDTRACPTGGAAKGREGGGRETTNGRMGVGRVGFKPEVAAFGVRVTAVEVHLMLYRGFKSDR